MQLIMGNTARENESEIAGLANPMWGGDWQSVRGKWNIDSSVTRFTHGAYGAVPKEIRQYQAALHRRIDGNPTGFYRRELEGLLESARLESAAFCGADPAGFAWVRNASEGLTVAIEAVPLEAGDEVIITNHAYSSVRLHAQKRCHAVGAKLVEAPVPFTEDDAVVTAVIAAAINKKTRMILVDEIASPTARIFPIRQIAEVARANDVALIVDGAHAPGMYALSVDTLGADMWVCSFHKWLCAPQGAGAIWVAPQWRQLVEPTSVSHRDSRPYPYRFGRLGTDDLTSMLCVPECIKLLKEIGLEKIYGYSAELASFGAKAIGDALGTAAVPGRYAARRLVALPKGVALDDQSALALQVRIATQLHTELSAAPPLAGEDHGALVVSAFLYNHPREYELFARELERFLN